MGNVTVGCARSFSFSLLLVIVMCSNSISYDIKHRNIPFSEYFLCGARSVGFFFVIQIVLLCSFVTNKFTANGISSILICMSKA